MRNCINLRSKITVRGNRQDQIVAGRCVGPVMVHSSSLLMCAKSFGRKLKRAAKAYPAAATATARLRNRLFTTLRSISDQWSNSWDSLIESTALAVSTGERLGWLGSRSSRFAYGTADRQPEQPVRQPALWNS